LNFGGPKKGGIVFQCMKLEESTAGEDSELEGTFGIGGNKFYDLKNEIPMKILELKTSGIGIIAKF
jgi:hypothetical protein